jgi:site-specific DNA recombinase
VLLIDEFHRAGVEIVFLNRPIGLSPEDDLLLQVQGIVAEYERAKILERSRRGKRHAARQGAVSVLSGAPYGYRYVDKRDGGVARYEILEDEARVVRRIFEWIGRDRVSIGETCRRLQQEGCLTRSSKPAWDRGTVWGILRNPAYVGTVAFGKTRIGPMPARCAEAPSSPAGPTRSTTWRQASGSASRSRRWSMRRCSRRPASNWRRTGAASGSTPMASATSCKGSSCAGNAATPITARPSA